MEGDVQDIVSHISRSFNMDSSIPAKKRKADCDPTFPLRGKDYPSTVLSVNLSLADLNRLVDQRVTEVVETKTLELASRVAGLQRENEGLLLRCESLERSVQVLKREGNWTYSAPDVPRSHWIDQGHGGDYADNADRLVRTIKRATQNVRSGSSKTITVSGSGNLSDTALDPHWEQLANAIQLSERIEELKLLHVQLDERTLQTINASVRQKGTTRFDLTRNHFRGGEGVEFAIDVLKSNRSVEHFCWCENTFRTAEEACKLVDAVLEHPTIRRLDLIRSLAEDNDPHAPVERLFRGVGGNTLLDIDLPGNAIKTNGDRCIPDFLSANPSLETLDLDGNQLTDDDALHIALALQSNTNLRYLDLRNNSLTEEGKDAMYHQAIFGISPSDVFEANLNSVSGANHTCRIVGISGPRKFMNRYNDSPKTANQNRGEKLFLFLKIRLQEGHIISELEKEFSEDSMGLVSHVLACINTYSADVPKQLCLSVLFEVARNWKTPEIYQLR